MIDFKSMKKVQDDKDMAVLQHEKGHQVKIVKSALSPVLLKQLSKLPLHQADPQTEVKDPTVSDEEAQSMTSDFGGDAKPDAEPPQKSWSDILNPFSQEHLTKLKENLQDAPDAVKQAAIDTILPGHSLVKTISQATEEPPAPTTAAPTLEPAAPAPEAPPAPAAPTSNDPLAPFKAIPGAKSTLAGIQGTSQAWQTGANARAALEQNAADIEAHERMLLRQNLAEKQQTIDAVTRDMLDPRSQIDPNHYMANRSVPQKIATAIGLILGGISSGQTGQPNPALAFLNKQIEQDLEAQKANMAQKHNVLSALNQQYGNTMVAENMFRAIRMNTLAHQINAAAATTDSALAKAAAQTATGTFIQSQIPLVQKSAILDQLSGRGQPGGASAMDPARKVLLMQKADLISPQQYEKANSEINIAQKTAIAHQTADSVVDQTMAQQTLANRVGSPIQSSQRIAALNAQLIPLILEASPSKRLTPDIVSEEIKPLMAKFTTNEATAEELKRGLHTIINAHADGTPTLDGLGISTPKYTGNPRAVRGADGKNYVRSPDGRHMIPVK